MPTLFPMSAHHPYNIPDEKISFALPEAYEGTLVGAYLQAQHYADATLGQFIGDLKAAEYGITALS